MCFIRAYTSTSDVMCVMTGVLGVLLGTLEEILHCSVSPEPSTQAGRAQFNWLESTMQKGDAVLSHFRSAQPLV